MDEPNRMERMVGELIGLRMLVTALVEENSRLSIKSTTLNTFSQNTVHTNSININYTDTWIRTSYPQHSHRVTL